ncbi:MAG TPA: hypothetical protein VGW40_04240 [Allosphingosinicella sp.]|nr:hypothetical protein [Allosphingosinicella sp.]
MPTTLTFTDSTTSYTVGTTQTPIANNTGRLLSLGYRDGTLVDVRAGGSVTANKTITKINYNATNYFPSQSNYTIAAGKTAQITVAGRNLDLIVN